MSLPRGLRPQGVPLLPLFLVSAASVGFETALTRYFAVAKWSEYGYWVISICMAGFALSGVVMALLRDRATRHAARLQQALPVLLILAAALGYWTATGNPFNPLQLQNPATYPPELGNIALYYLELLPFFFLAGLYVSLCFVLTATRMERTYAYDLTGAGAGAALALGLMFFLHPFQLVPALLVPLALAAFFAPRRWLVGGVAVVALLGCEALLLLDNQAAFNQYKSIYAPLHVQNSRVVAERDTPRGLYTLLDDFTERLDTDVSNDAAMLGLPGPPRSFGLYRDGNRIAALPMRGQSGAAYAGAALDALPYSLLARPRVLLVGASGGFRVTESLALGARRVDALEPDPVLMGALRHGLGPSPGLAADPRVRLLAASPVALASRGGKGFNLVDLSADFLDEAEANATAFSAEAITAYLRALAPDGVVSIPVSIREFPAYAVRMLGTVREALLAAGVLDPAQNVVVYRSAWNVRILLGTTPFDADRVAAIRKFCDDRSFDVSYYPGIDVAAARTDIYNDLPAVSFEAGSVASGGGNDDAVADEAGAALHGAPTGSGKTFNLAPITLDRPFYYSVLRLDHLPLILKRLEILPQAEIGQLVNLAVLLQAMLFAACVLLVPLAAPWITGARSAARPGVVRSVLYFASLGLGFLFIEIFLIDRASFWLNDRTSAFALVLTFMLICSGIGSLLAERVNGLAVPAAIIVLWCGFAYFGLPGLMLATLDWPFVARAALLLAVLAPVSIALGMPFPLGLAWTARAGGGFLPWAWGLNGAFSVVATPLANLLAVQGGYDRVLLAATLLYVVALLTYPSARRIASWQDVSEPSPDAG